VSINVMVSERVLLLGNTVYAETRRHVFRKHVGPRHQSILRLGHAIRDSRVIPLAEWECFSKRGALPAVYLQAVALQ